MKISTPSLLLLLSLLVNVCLLLSSGNASPAVAAADNIDVDTSSWFEKPKKGLIRQATNMGRGFFDMSNEKVAYENVVSGIIYFKSLPSRASLETLLRERLFRFPRFRSILRNDEGNKNVVWEEVGLDEIDMNYHITALPTTQPLTTEEFDTLLGEQMAVYMDRTQPLWRFFLVPLADGRFASIVRIHHSIADGTTLVKVILSLTDEDSASNTGTVVKQKAASSEPWIQGCQLSDVIHKAQVFCQGVWQAMTLGNRRVDSPTRLKATSTEAIDAVRTVSFAPPIALQKIRVIKTAVGGTVNDAMFAILTKVVREYLLLQKDPLMAQNNGKDVQFSVLFPLNLRFGKYDIEDPMMFGNQFLGVPMQLPLHISDRMTLLETLKAQCDDLKKSPFVPVASSIQKAVIPYIPANVTLDAVKKLMDAITMVFSNVPGPSSTVFLAGKEVEDISFLSPVPVGSTMSAFSYRGKINVGFTTDPKFVDAKLLARLYSKEVDEFYREAIKYVF